MADEAQLDAIARANAFAVYNGITTHQTGDGTAEAILEIGPDSLNPLAQYKSSEDFANGIHWILTEPEYSELSEQARRKVLGNYSESIVAKRLVFIILLFMRLRKRRQPY